MKFAASVGPRVPTPTFKICPPAIKTATPLEIVREPPGRISPVRGRGGRNISKMGSLKATFGPKRVFKFRKHGVLIQQSYKNSSMLNPPGALSRRRGTWASGSVQCCTISCLLMPPGDMIKTTCVCDPEIGDCSPFFSRVVHSPLGI